MDTESYKNFANVPVLWEPGPDSGKLLKKFKKIIEEKYDLEFKDYWALHKWTTDNLAEFWDEIWKFSGIVHSAPYEKVIDLNVPMQDAPEWFIGAKLNFAENLLRYRDDHIAIISAGEDKETEKISYSQMYEEAKLYAAALKKCGLEKGDRVVCYMSNRKEPVFACLGVTSMAAIWTGALPLLGAQAVLNRFKQVNPKIMFTIDRFLHDQEEKEMLHKVKEIVKGLPSLEKVVIVPSKENSKLKDISDIRNSCWLDEFLELGRESDGSVPPLQFEQVAFDYPIFISYTSGTTGLPKALVHGSGVLLSMARDFWLHNDSNRERTWLSMSPVGWASWNMLTSMHFLGITMVLFEGVPYFLTPTHMWDMVEEFQITNLFLSVNVLDDLEKKGYVPTEKHKLSSLLSVFSGGSVVKPQNYDFVYKKIKKDMIFCAAYGSTEFMGSCMIFDHTLKIHRGEITCASLGIDIHILDESGKPIMGEVGDMVVVKPTPSLPTGVWGDKEGSRLKENYFSRFPGKFYMGDLGMINPVTKGFIICGRSDDTLKPGGCRFGSSEIYNIVDTFSEVRDSLCVSQYSAKGVERAVLFLKMRNDHRCDLTLVDKIRAKISSELSSRHVPEIIIDTADIPYNLNGKKMEIIVKNIINGRKYSEETVINPECLQNFFNVPQLAGF